MTLFGKHTVAETRDLIRASDFRINKVIKQYEKVLASRVGPKTSLQSRLDSDMSAFVNRWIDVRDNTTLKLAFIVMTHPVPTEILTCEPEFVDVTNAVSRTEPRLMDVQQRVENEAAILALPPVNFEGLPSQNSTDVDFAALRKLDAEITKAEIAAKEAAAATQKAAAKLPWYVWVGGATAVGIVAFPYVSPFLPRRR